MVDQCRAQALAHTHAVTMYAPATQNTTCISYPWWPLVFMRCPTEGSSCTTRIMMHWYRMQPACGMHVEQALNKFKSNLDLDHRAVKYFISDRTEAHCSTFLQHCPLRQNTVNKVIHHSITINIDCVPAYSAFFHIFIRILLTTDLVLKNMILLGRQVITHKQTHTALMPDWNVQP